MSSEDVVAEIKDLPSGVPALEQGGIEEKMMQYVGLEAAAFRYERAKKEARKPICHRFLAETKKELHIAPMLDVSNREFRYFMRLLSKRMTLWTEMVVDQTILNCDDINSHLGFLFTRFQAEKALRVFQGAGAWALGAFFRVQKI